MSALLPLIKSHRAMAAALEEEAASDEDGQAREALMRTARINRRAADLLEREMQAETTGEGGTTWRPTAGVPRKVGGRPPTRGMGSR